MKIFLKRLWLKLLSLLLAVQLGFVMPMAHAFDPLALVEKLAPVIDSYISPASVLLIRPVAHAVDTCDLGSDVGVINCANELLNNPAMADLVAQSGVTAVQLKKVLEIYLDIKSQDFYELFSDILALAAGGSPQEVACKVIAIVASGFPVCEALEALIAIGEGLADAGRVLLEGLGVVDPKAKWTPDQWYAHYVYEGYTYFLWADDVAQKSVQLYNDCYKYFEASDMSSSTADSACKKLQARHVEEASAVKQWTALLAEIPKYYDTVMKPKSAQTVSMNDTQFEAFADDLAKSCRAHFLAKYPKAVVGGKLYRPNVDTIEGQCQRYRSQFAALRDKSQGIVASDVAKSLWPFCKYGVENQVICETAEAYNFCRSKLSKTCEAANTANGGKAFPCCEVGPVEPRVGAAKQLADKSGAGLCRIAQGDPLRVECANEPAVKHCRANQGAQGYTAQCMPEHKNAFGMSTQICCSVNAAVADSAPGVAKAKAAYEKLKGKPNVSYPGSMDGSAGNDPRVVLVGSDLMTQCRQAIGNQNACQAGGGGLATDACCAQTIFGTAVATNEYDPSKRDPGELAKAKQTASMSGCTPFQTITSAISVTGGGNAKTITDEFHLMCANKPAYDKCVKAFGGDVRPSASACSAPPGFKATPYVLAPCCEATFQNVAIAISNAPPVTSGGAAAAAAASGQTAGQMANQGNFKAAPPPPPPPPPPPAPSNSGSGGSASAAQQAAAKAGQGGPPAGGWGGGSNAGSNPFGAAPGASSQPATCQKFLGRADELLCADQPGFDACKKLVNEGKMKSCRKQGSPEVYTKK